MRRARRRRACLMPGDDPEPGGPLILTRVLGRVADPIWHDLAHRATAAGLLETIRISRSDAPRRRMRLTTDRGRDVALSLERDQVLADGSVLHAADDLMIVLRIDGGPRLRLVPGDAASALRLGYFCGNLHWKADFDGAALQIHVDGPEDDFRARLADAAKLCTFTTERRDADE